MELKNKQQDIISIEKHGEWVKDDVDKVLNYVLSTNQTGLTFNTIQKKVLEILVEQISKGTTLSQQILKLVEKGILKEKPKETTLKLFELNKE